jgi:hypothetical protein
MRRSAKLKAADPREADADDSNTPGKFSGMRAGVPRLEIGQDIESAPVSPRETREAGAADEGPPPRSRRCGRSRCRSTRPRIREATRRRPPATTSSNRMTPGLRAVALVRIRECEADITRDPGMIRNIPAGFEGPCRCIKCGRPRVYRICKSLLEAPVQSSVQAALRARRRQVTRRGGRSPALLFEPLSATLEPELPFAALRSPRRGAARRFRRRFAAVACFRRPP